jgi:hypothetical protein
MNPRADAYGWELGDCEGSRRVESRRMKEKIYKEMKEEESRR